MHDKETLTERGQHVFDRLGARVQTLEWQAWNFAQRQVNGAQKRLHAAGDVTESVFGAVGPIVGTAIGKTVKRADYCVNYVHGRHDTKSRLATRRS